LLIPIANSGNGASSSSSGDIESRSAFLRIDLSWEGIAINTEIWSISTRTLGTGISGYWVCPIPSDSVAGSCCRWNLEKRCRTREGGCVVDGSNVDGAG